jgi:hypothetical protein
MDLVNHCAAFPGLSLLNTRAVQVNLVIHRNYTPEITHWASSNTRCHDSVSAEGWSTACATRWTCAADSPRIERTLMLPLAQKHHGHTVNADKGNAYNVSQCIPFTFVFVIIWNTFQCMSLPICKAAYVEFIWKCFKRQGWVRSVCGLN